MRADMPVAYRVGEYQGKRCYVVPVRVRFNSSRLCATVHTETFEVVARSVVEAVNAVRDMVHVPEVEVEARGPKGGKVYRYIGWESYIWSEMCRRKEYAPVQRSLRFEGEQQ